MLGVALLLLFIKGPQDNFCIEGRGIDYKSVAFDYEFEQYVISGFLYNREKGVKELSNQLPFGRGAGGGGELVY